MIDEYENYPSLENMKNALIKTNIGYDPQKDKKYNWNKQNEKTVKKYWLACKLQKQRGDISKINCFPYADLLTFSFPCQSISVSGKQEGIIQGETKSGLVYEVLRILENMKTKNILPKYLLLENVKNLVGKKFIDDFNNLNSILDDIGYNVYWKVINAKNCNIPQNRERVFGIYIRKDIDNQTFEFPNNLPLEYKLKDLLEKEVDKKYYITDGQIERLKINPTGDKLKILDTSQSKREGKAREYENICPTLTARDYKDPKCVQINLQQNVKIRKYTVNTSLLQECLKDNKGEFTNKDIANQLNIPVTKVEHWFRTDSSFSIPSEDIWMELKKLLNIQTNEFDSSIMEFEIKPNEFDISNRAYHEDGISPTLTTTSPPKCVQVGSLSGGKWDNMHESSKRVYDESGISPTIHTCGGGNIEPKVLQTVCEKRCNDFRIRKLTPTECYMLQGFTKEDINKCYAVDMSNTQLYRQAGNSIVTNCIELLFEHLYKSQYNSEYICQDENF